MGKSPGKWIKAKLFGKKSAKSNISKGGQAGKEAFIISKVSSGAVATNEPVISNPQPVPVIERNGHNVANGNQIAAKPQEDSTASSSGSQDGGIKATGLTSSNNSNIQKQEQAAAKVQAALRGFLARRAFWTLKGIIRLQALIRGHLARRQAVATLRSMQAIIKFQSLVRGRNVRLSEAGKEVKEKCNIENLKLHAAESLLSNPLVKLSRNTFAQKLLASVPNAMPVSIHYNSGEANSPWNWLERWSLSQFWVLVVELKKGSGSKSSRKSGGNKGVELENGRQKRGVRKSSSMYHESNQNHSSEHGKPRGMLRKSISHQTEVAQENPQNELEKVKRSLRKVSLTKTEISDNPETVIEKPKNKGSKIRDTFSPTIQEQGLNKSVDKDSDPIDAIASEKINDPVDAIPEAKENGSVDVIPLEPETVKSPQQLVEESGHEMPDEPSLEAVQQTKLKEEYPPAVNEELHAKENSNGKENLRARRRRSLSAKHEYPENGSQNTPTLPSYMQATQSAKAKLRAQGSPRLSQDATDNGVIRRHSLPSSTGGKLNTPSPRIQKLVQGSGKGGFKSDKSLSASKDYSSNERVAEWRR